MPPVPRAWRPGPLLLALALAVQFPASASAACLNGLGDLFGGGLYSQAADVSADGAVVVGRSRSSGGMEAFR